MKEPMLVEDQTVKGISEVVIVLFSCSFKSVFRTSLLALILLMAGCTESSANLSKVSSTSSGIEGSRNEKAIPEPLPPKSNASAESRIINPLTNVGPITRETSEGDLINLFGVENVEAILIPVGEGETVPGTRLFGGTPNAVDIEWKYSSHSPQRITIRSGGTYWQTSEGLKIGSSLAEVTLVNGRPFDLTGFGWDYPGRTVDWQGGSLVQELQIDFRPTQQIPTDEVLYGSGPFSSQETAMQKMDLVIEAISVRWD